MPAQKNRNKLSVPEASEAPEASGVPAAPNGTEAQTYAVHRENGSVLAQILMDPRRSFTVVVISYINADVLRIDAARVAAQVGSAAQVFEVANGVETHRLERALPELMHIFGTGARVYPHGHQWTTRTPRPHVPRRRDQVAALYQSLELEVLAAEYSNAPATPPVSVISEALVMGFPAADRAVVEVLPGGEQAVIRGEDLLPGVPVSWLVNKGQRLTGLHNPGTHVFDINSLLLPRPSPVSVYKHGDVALARVNSVCAEHALVHLWPNNDFRIGVESISSNDLDSAEDLLTEGEVVRVRVLYENGAVRLSMLDVDDDETAEPAPALVRGGPAWLDYDRPYTSIFTAGSAVTGTTPDGLNATSQTGSSGVDHDEKESLLSPAQRRTALQSTQMQLVSARRTIDDLVAAAKQQGATDKVARALQDQLEDERRDSAGLARRLGTAEHQIEAIREELARTKTALVQLRQQRRSATSRTEMAAETLFTDPANQFTFDLLQAWARSVPPAEKDAHPLGTYSCNPQFLASWLAITEQQRSKTLRAVVDLVAERTGALRKREPHVLRLNEGAHAKPTMRGEDVCMRLYVEQRTAGALRLHYWKLRSGGVELHEVVSHNVVKP